MCIRDRVSPIFKEELSASIIRHKENEYNDFETRPLLTNRRSTRGPGLSAVDLNGDLFDELIMGSSKGHRIEFASSNKNLLSQTFTWGDSKKLIRDTLSLIPFINNENKMNLIGVQSNYEDGLAVGNSLIQFTKKTSAAIQSSVASGVGPIAMADIDKDGDLDIAYNNNPGGIKYDLSYQSVIFNYGNGHFIVSSGVGNGDVTNWNPNAWSYDGEDNADKFFVAFNYDNGDAFYFTYVNNVVDWSVEDDTDNELVLTISQIEINEPKYQLSANLDATKNVLEAHSEEVISGTLNFNDGNNIVILDGQAETYRGLTGDDTYFVSQLLPKNGKVSIIDTEGLNIIQIPSNTYVDKSLFTKNAARLTLEDGREITINGADKFSYNVGGNVTDGTAGIDLTYADFATSFGISDVLNSSDAQTGVISDMYII